MVRVVLCEGDEITEDDDESEGDPGCTTLTFITRLEVVELMLFLFLSPCTVDVVVVWVRVESQNDDDDDGSAAELPSALPLLMAFSSLPDVCLAGSEEDEPWNGEGRNH